MNNSQEGKISIIIPTYNGRYLLESSLRSACLQSYKQKEVIVVDNNSSDDTEIWMREYYPKVIYLKLRRNFGFAYAVNCGIRIAKGEYIALLNNDAIADRDWLKFCIDAFKLDKDIACVTPKITKISDSARIDSVGDLLNIVGQAYSRGEGELDQQKYNISKYVFAASGCAPIYRTNIFKGIGLFEETFISYFEDMDLSWRLQKKGYRIWYCNNAYVQHIRSETSIKMDNRDYLLFRNMVLCQIINLPTSLLLYRKTLLKTLTVYIHTIWWLFYRNYSLAGIYVLRWALMNLSIILDLRRSRLTKHVSDAYLDSWRINKTIKLFGIKF